MKAINCIYIFTFVKKHKNKNVHFLKTFTCYVLFSIHVLCVFTIKQKRIKWSIKINNLNKKLNYIYRWKRHWLIENISALVITRAIVTEPTYDFYLNSFFRLGLNIKTKTQSTKFLYRTFHDQSPPSQIDSLLVLRSNTRPKVPSGVLYVNEFECWAKGLRFDPWRYQKVIFDYILIQILVRLRDSFRPLQSKYCLVCIVRKVVGLPKLMI